MRRAIGALSRNTRRRRANFIWRCWISRRPRVLLVGRDRCWLRGSASPRARGADRRRNSLAASPVNLPQAGGARYGKRNSRPANRKKDFTQEDADWPAETEGKDQQRVSRRRGQDQARGRAGRAADDAVMTRRAAFMLSSLLLGGASRLVRSGRRSRRSSGRLRLIPKPALPATASNRARKIHPLPRRPPARA